MPVIKLSLTDTQFERLTVLAGKKSIQQYLRELAGVEEDLFTPQEAVRRIKEKFENSPPPTGETFTFCLPDLYEDEEWASIGRGMAGLFGKHFFNYVDENPELGIRFVEISRSGRRAVYKYEKGVCQA